jgi:vacuolar protein sorting-associated protein 72
MEPTNIPIWGPESPMSSVSSLSDFPSTPSGDDVEKSKRPSKGADSQANSEGTVEWLATTRERRSTAGNRMKSMLANEEPDSDLELLFAEDENDQGFSEVDENASDVQMDSSDDEDDNGNNDDDLEGEKELEKQAKERRAAQRKRKAQEAIPAKFRKKVRIDPTTRTPSAPMRPAPRPKKKSERTSWLPSAADLPTRRPRPSGGVMVEILTVRPPWNSFSYVERFGRQVAENNFGSFRQPELTLHGV